MLIALRYGLPEVTLHVVLHTVMYIYSISDRRAHVYPFNIRPDQLEDEINRPTEAQILTLF